MRELDELSERIWQWRAQTSPRSTDDLPRLDRPAGWLPSIGADAWREQRARRDAYALELAGIVPVERADVVDARLLRSALARVTWELDVVRVWSHPRFYTGQALGPVFDLLLPPGVDAARVAEVLRHLDAVPAVLAVGLETLPGVASAELTRLAVQELAGVEGRLATLAAALATRVPERGRDLASATRRAAASLRDYASTLEVWLPGLPAWEPVGEEALSWFLAEVAYVPYAPRDLLRIGELEFERAAVLELLERRRLAGLERPPLPRDADEQVGRERADELAVRAFYEREGLLTQPVHLGHYRTAPMPDYLAPLRFLGVADDLTGPGRLDEDGTAYVPEPAEDLPYFYAANARDPRAGIVHEGVHYQQLTLSWGHPRPVRRHYYDSSANEGIAFYNEELMLRAGLFDDAPHTRAIIANFMRLRALRVTIDVGLATGSLTIEQAAARLRADVPMDEATAREEAAFFAETPGQAMSYQIGKTQVLALLAELQRERGRDFDLRAFHDRLWLEGNVPIALQRYELLG